MLLASHFCSSMLLSRRLAEAAVRRVEEREARLQEELKQQEERRMRQVEDELRKVAAEQEKERSEAGKTRRPSRFAVSSVPGEDSPSGLSIPGSCMPHRFARTLGRPMWATSGLGGHFFH